MILPSKELLGAVLGTKVYLEDLWDVEDNTLFYYLDSAGKIGAGINIHDLMNKCKIWAIQLKRYMPISSGIDFDVNFKATTPLEIEQALNNIRGGLYGYAKIESEQKAFNAKTESEAVFKACEWIFKCKN